MSESPEKAATPFDTLMGLHDEMMNVHRKMYFDSPPEFQLRPMVMAVSGNGTSFSILSSDFNGGEVDKARGRFIEAVKLYLEESQAQRYAYVSEVWMTHDLSETNLKINDGDSVQERQNQAGHLITYCEEHFSVLVSIFELVRDANTGKVIELKEATAPRLLTEKEATEMKTYNWFAGLLDLTEKPMKTLYTSSYERNGKNPLALSISNAAWVPAEYEGKKNALLGPSSQLLEAYHEGKIDHDTYSKNYLAELDARGLTAQKIIDDVPEGTIFVCFDYEDGDASICHRFSLSKWLNETKLATVTEI